MQIAKPENYLKGTEPSPEEISAYMVEHNESFYNAREALRCKAYGGSPPDGCSSWDDFWKRY